MAQIVCKNLAVGYGNTVVKSNINFNVEKGDYLCIVGENGSGKSTFVKALPAAAYGRSPPVHIS